MHKKHHSVALGVNVNPLFLRMYKAFGANDSLKRATIIEAA